MNKYQLIACLVLVSACGDPSVVVGPAGPQGEQGIQGEQGDSGADGLDGSDGANGEKGDSGDAGLHGTNGIDGFSIVTNSRSATNLECSNGGSALDVYTDLDRSLNFSSGDLLQNTLVSCNGAPGPAGADGAQGPQGPQGVPATFAATISTTPSLGSLTTTCVAVTDTSLFARKKTSNPSDIDLDVYSSLDDCNALANKLVRLNPETNELFWVSDSILLSAEGATGQDNTKIRAITFLQ